jgi:DNA-binding HxlR family transcriptional regulator
MLSERLQELEDEGLVERAVVPDTPVRVEYSLTRKGKGLAEAIETLSNWAEKNISLTAATKPRARRRAAR